MVTAASYAPGLFVVGVAMMSYFVSYGRPCLLIGLRTREPPDQRHKVEARPRPEEGVREGRGRLRRRQAALGFQAEGEVRGKVEGRRSR